MESQVIRSTIGKTQSQENCNPENGWNKLVNLQGDKDGLTECRLLLQSMKEEHQFQKQMFHRTFDQSIPRSTKSESSRQQNYKNYQKLLTYSRKKQNAEQFANKSIGKIKINVRKNKAQSLKQFISAKKTKMLTEESKEANNDSVIQGLLNSDKTRQKLFDEAILLERLYYIKRQQNKQQGQEMPIPKKFKGLDPKHLRVPQLLKNENHFHRRKYVHYQKSYQYFKKALKTQNNLLKNKQKENTKVLMNLMDHFKEQVLSTKSSDISSRINMCIHRLFLKYASSGSQDVKSMYKKINKSNVYQLMDDFGLDWENNQKVKEIVEKYQITEFYFLEIIYLLSRKYEQELITDTNQFIMDNILSKPKIYLPKQWQIIFQHQSFISKHLKIRRFRQKLQLINLSQIKSSENRGYINFDEMVQVMWILKIYPFMISKKKLRFFYLYSQSQESGINIDSLVNIYLCVAVSREGNLEQNIKEIVGMVVDYSKSRKDLIS